MNGLVMLAILIGERALSICNVVIVSSLNLGVMNINWIISCHPNLCL